MYTCIEDSLELFASIADDKGLELAYWIDSNVPVDVLGDEARVRQILINLVGNGVKFTERGEVLVTVHAEPVPQDMSSIASSSETTNEGSPTGSFMFHIRVQDTGIGMSPEQQKRIFQEFDQGDVSTTRTYGGTGLGLTITQQLVHLMEGSIEVESMIGVGTTFHVTFVARPAPKRLRPFALLRQPYVQDKRVLVVSANKTTKQLLHDYTTRWHMHSVQTSLFNDAMNRLKQSTPFDIVVIDIRESYKGDTHVLAQIEHLENISLPLILYCTHKSKRILPERLTQGNRVRILYKPVRPAQLHDAIIRLLNVEDTSPIPTSQTVVLDGTLGLRHPLRILLAEDSFINRKLFTQFLAKLGYRANAVTNGHGVLNAVKRATYDVILMDIDMPDMDGIEATKHIRAEIPKERQPYIIAITGYVQAELQETCFSAGIDDCVVKPVKLEDLVAKISKIQALSSGESSC